MLKPLFACLTLAVLPAAAFAQAPQTSDWRVVGGPQGCIAHTTLPQGTVVSIMAGPEQEALLFMVQNRQWSNLKDGGKHQIAVQLDGENPWQFDAVAKTELDSDGPGLLFVVPPGEQDGARFITAFASAAGMNVGEGGQSLGTARLTGGNTAMAGLAQCMAKMWGGTGTAPAGKPAAGLRL